MPRQSWLCILIAAFAFYNLWIRMLINGTLASIDSIKASKILPGGKRLRLEYTSISVLDDSLATLVIFFDPLLDRSNPNGRLLMLDVLVTLHSAIMWITVESQRKYQKHWLLNLTALFGFLWNAVGAGFVLPLYCFFYFAFGRRSTRPPPSLPEAQALAPSVLLASYVPLVIAIGAPLVFASDPATVQGITAAFQFGPVVSVVFQKLLSLFLPQMRGSCRREDDLIAGWYVKLAYLISAVACGLTHLYCFVSIALAGKGSSISFSGVFLPSPDSVVPGSDMNLPEGSTLFMHFDNLFISVTCMFWAGVVLRERLCRVKSRLTLAVIGLAVSCFILGPGATLSAALYLSEDCGFIELVEYEGE
ncbi:MAG: hypothetical protein Q9228_003058 [Teloschistes exilis]